MVLYQTIQCILFVNVASTQRWKHGVDFNMIEPLQLRLQQQSYSLISVDVNIPQHRILQLYEILPGIDFGISSTNHSQSFPMAHESLRQVLRVHNTAGKYYCNTVDCKIYLQTYGALKSASGGVELPCRFIQQTSGSHVHCEMAS